MSVTRDVEILLVEPDADEARLAAGILKRAMVRSRVTVTASGAEAMAHLLRQGSHFRAPRPNLILLSADGLPDRGHELLSEIKRNSRLLHIPVVFMSASETETAVRTAYDLEANCFVHKPLNEEELNRVLETTREFWLTIAKLPSE